MNYERYAIDKLRNYQTKAAATVNLREELQELQARQTGLKSTRYDAVCVTGTDTSKAQDAMISLIADIDEKRELYRSNSREIRRIERALAVLSADERLVLDVFFISPVSDPVGSLKDRRHFERTWIYNTRRDALRKFTKALYGAVDT